MTKQAWTKIGLVAGAVALMGGAWRAGILSRLGDPESLRVTMVGLGGWGYLAFVLAYAALQPFGVPGTVFILAAPLIWPWPVAFGLSMAGTMAASVIGFSFARYVARDWVSGRVPARLRRYEDALARRGFVTVAALRFVFWMPQVLHTFLAVSKVTFAEHFWGSLVGYVVPLLVVSYFGERFFDMLRTAPPSTWVWIAGSVAVGVAVLTWHRRRRTA